MPFIDPLLNRITMYRVVLYVLCVLFGIALLYSALGILPYAPSAILFSGAVLLGVSWGANTLLAKYFGAVANVESVYITALILALLITPVAPTDIGGIVFLSCVALWATASKYLIAPGKKHIFNPAAFGLVLATLLIDRSATWWVAGNMAMLPFVLIGGVLIARKIRRFDVVLAGVSAALLAAFIGGGFAFAQKTLLVTPLLFLAFVMLTEPLTLPPSRTLRLVYGALVGVFIAPNVHVGSWSVSPELALLIGNLFSFIVSPKGRYQVTLVEKREIAQGTFEFAFRPDRPLSFTPGQYVEWTLGHAPSDARGNRRYFTIASSPAAADGLLRLGVRIGERKSSFKTALMALAAGDILSVSSLAGDFTLPKDPSKKLVFIAGGIGITPFRSMIGALMDAGEKRSVTLLYSNKTAREIAYRDVFDTAANTIGLKTLYAITNEPTTAPHTHQGLIDRALIEREVPDYRERIFYISGPHAMVDAFKKTLTDMGVSRLHIKTDYFPGFA